MNLTKTQFDEALHSVSEAVELAARTFDGLDARAEECVKAWELIRQFAINNYPRV